jgi:phage protein D
METVAKNIVEISIAGKNITADVSRYLAQITYTDKEEAESDDLSLVFEDTSGKWQGAWYPTQGDTLRVKIGRPGHFLDCGIFEIDEIELNFPPDTLNVKAIGAGITKSLRTRNSKAFEEQTLYDIAKYFADKHGLKLVGDNVSLQIKIERKTQENQTDISFLSTLAKEYGIIFAVHGDWLYFTDISELDRRSSILTISRSQMSTARFVDKTSQIYSGATILHRNARNNIIRKWEIKQPDGPDEKLGTLVVNANVESDDQAEAVAKGSLKNANKDKIKGSFTIFGNTKLVAGVNVDLTGIGKFSGKWHITSSSHTVQPSGGYTTSVELRKII